MVMQMKESGISERRCCRALRLWRASVRYEPRPEDPLNEVIREEMIRLAKRHRRFGSPRMTAMLRTGSRVVNHKRVERLYRQVGLTLPRRRKRKRRGTPAEQRPYMASKPNEVWSCDFVHDRTEYGQRLKMLTVVDEYTRECLEIRVEKRMNGVDVLETFDELFHERGAPAHIRSDNGAEFISKKFSGWLYEQGVHPVYIEPGSPWENGYIESFNGKFRDECLEEELFWSRGEAQVIVDWWRTVYNQERPHSSLGYETPFEYAARAALHEGQQGQTSNVLH
jgi:putative transposase